MKRASAMALMLLLCAACAGDLEWVQVVSFGGRPPERLLWHGEDLWAFGGSAAARRHEGSWEVLDVCHGQGKPSAGGFKSGELWVLCSTDLGLQKLLRYDGAQVARLVSLPADRNFDFLPLRDDFLLLGEKHVWDWDGSGFQVLVDPPSNYGYPKAWRGSGLTKTAFFLDNQFWNGEGWTPAVADTTDHPRFFGDRLLIGQWLFDATGQGEQLEFPSTGGRDLFFLGTPDLENGFFQGSPGYLWRAEEGDLDFLGSAHPDAMINPVCGAGYVCPAVLHFYAIDDETLLLMNSDGFVEASL